MKERKGVERKDGRKVVDIKGEKEGRKEGYNGRKEGWIQWKGYNGRKEGIKEGRI